MKNIKERLGEKMTITITRWRACLLVSFATFSFAMAAQMVQRLINSHRWFDVFELAVDGFVVALIMAFIFYVAGDEMVSPKQDSSKSS
jgi:uncharacterized membrane protein